MTSSDFVLVLEYIDGEILSNWMKFYSKQINWNSFSEIIKQILLGLSYLHDNKFVHGDIRPETIIIENKTNRVKIVDFGSSGMVGELVHIDDGRKNYQPPDLHKHGKHPGQDTYAVGVMLYQYLFGDKPFTNISETSFENSRPNMLFDVNPVVKKIILKACEPILENRYKNAQDMYKAFKDAKLVR